MAKNYYSLVQIKNKFINPGSPIIPIKFRNMGKSWHLWGNQEKMGNRKSKVVEKPFKPN